MESAVRNAVDVTTADGDIRLVTTSRITEPRLTSTRALYPVVL